MNNHYKDHKVFVIGPLSLQGRFGIFKYTSGMDLDTQNLSCSHKESVATTCEPCDKCDIH